MTDSTKQQNSSSRISLAWTGHRDVQEKEDQALKKPGLYRMIIAIFGENPGYRILQRKQYEAN